MGPERQGGQLGPGEIQGPIQRRIQVSRERFKGIQGESRNWSRANPATDPAQIYGRSRDASWDRFWKRFSGEIQWTQEQIQGEPEGRSWIHWWTQGRPRAGLVASPGSAVLCQANQFVKLSFASGTTFCFVAPGEKRTRRNG